jgi:hypothetical protein
MTGYWMGVVFLALGVRILLSMRTVTTRIISLCVTNWLQLRWMKLGQHERPVYEMAGGIMMARMNWRQFWRAVLDGFDSFNLNGNVRNPYHFTDDAAAIRDDWLKVGQDLANAMDQFADEHKNQP